MTDERRWTISKKPGSNLAKGLKLSGTAITGPDTDPIEVVPAQLLAEREGQLADLLAAVGRVNYDGEAGDVEELDEARRVAEAVVKP